MMNFLNVLRQLSGPTVAVVIRLRHDLGSGTVAGEREMSQMTNDECLRKHLDKERILDDATQVAREGLWKMQFRSLRRPPLWCWSRVSCWALDLAPSSATAPSVSFETAPRAMVARAMRATSMISKVVDIIKAEEWKFLPTFVVEIVYVLFSSELCLIWSSNAVEFAAKITCPTRNRNVKGMD